MSKSTQIILAIGAVGVGALAVVEFSNGFNQAEANVGTGAGWGFGLLGGGAGVALVVLALSPIGL